MERERERERRLRARVKITRRKTLRNSHEKSTCHCESSTIPPALAKVRHTRIANH